MREVDKNFVIQLLHSDLWRMRILRTARSLNLPDWCISAGFVRNMVWDLLHGIHSTKTDIDVVYFDAKNTEEDVEKEYEHALSAILDEPWSVKNQARMALRNKQVYRSTEDAIAHYPETATAVGVRLERGGTITLIAPYGIEDVTSGIIRATPKFSLGHTGVLERCKKKGWLATWPKLQVRDIL